MQLKEINDRIKTLNKLSRSIDKELKELFVQREVKRNEGQIDIKEILK